MPGIRSDSYALLALLAVHPRGRTLEEVADALHPDAGEASAKPRARTAITSLRTALREATGQPAQMFVLHENGLYRLDQTQLGVDLWQLLTTIDAANQAPDGQTCLHALREALSLYRGDYAAGLDHAWAGQHRDTYRRHALDALDRIAEITEIDRPDIALAALNRGIEIDTINEQLYQRMMRIQGRQSRPDAVQRTLHLCTTRLADIDAEPSTATLRIAQRQTRPTGEKGGCQG